MLLRDHAELRPLIGKNPCTALMILGCVYLQVGLACLLRDAPWWLILLTAFTIGACLSHALWTLIHECAHNLVFAKTYLNTLASITANLPHLLPSARTARGRVALNDEFKPDVEFLESSPRA